MNRSTSPMYEVSTSQRKFNYTGRHRSIVVDPKDPDKFGKVKVWIPDLMGDEISKDTGIWAWPGNNQLGGRNVDKNNEPHHYGTCWIPILGDWVWVEFENDNPNRPYYTAAVNISHKKVPPENQLGNEYWNKWTVLRSPKGRVVVISDDPDDERYEITGKKRQYKNQEVDATSSVYTIDDNQTTILVDERDGKMKVLIKDYKGNYLNIKQTDDSFNIFGHGKLKVHFEDDADLTFDKNVFAHIKGTFKLKVEQNFILHVFQQVKWLVINMFNLLCSGGNINMDANNIFLNTGTSQTESIPGTPEQPDGERK